jgi:mono/diheme cytochrome c family protein
LARSARGLLALALAVPGPAAAAAPPRTTRDRIYSAAQADRGKQVYQEICVQCHALEFYRGETMKSWNGGSLSDLYDALSVKMPQSNPGSLKRRQYLDILAYILALNGMPAGEQELPAAAAELKAIRIKWGSKP